MLILSFSQPANRDSKVFFAKHHKQERTAWTTACENPHKYCTTCKVAYPPPIHLTCKDPDRSKAHDPHPNPHPSRPTVFFPGVDTKLHDKTTLLTVFQKCEEAVLAATDDCGGDVAGSRKTLGLAKEVVEGMLAHPRLEEVRAEEVEA